MKPEASRRRWGIAFAASLAAVALPCLLGTGAFLYFEAASAPSPRPVAPTSATSTSGSGPAPASDELARYSDVAPRAASSPSSAVAPAAAVLAPSAQAAPRFRDAASGWQQPGLCAGQTPEQLAARTAYLGALRQYQHPNVALYADAAISDPVLAQVALRAAEAPSLIDAAIGIKPLLPKIYVHRSLELLRKNSCVGAPSVAFYDGAIHLADLSQQASGLAEMGRSLLHELTHHALMSHGVREPVWLQEGLAMHVAGERDFALASIPPPGIDLREMVDGFPHTAPPEHAERFYGQAYAMVGYLRLLCGVADPSCPLHETVEALRSGRASPSTLFEQTILHYRPHSREPASTLWQRYLNQRAGGANP